MADFWSHIIGGEILLEGIEDRVWKKMVRENKKVFNLGCQGPDLFFYNDFLPWIRKKRGPAAGIKIQREKIALLFQKTALYIKKVKESDSDTFTVIAPYFTGFLAHYLLDRRIHPFIIKHQKSSEDHKRLEILIDCYLMEKHRGKKAYLCSPVKAINLGERLPGVIKEFYCEILSNVHRYPRDVDFIDDSYRDMKRVLNIFYSPGPFKRPLFQLLNLPLSADLTALTYPVNPEYDRLSQGEWRQVESILERSMEEGIELHTLIKRFIDGNVSLKVLKNSLPSINFDGE